MYSAILLAAGKSSRMGKLKALLEWKNMTLIEYQIQQVALSRINELIVVVGYGAANIRPTLSMCKKKYQPQLNLNIITNTKFEEGKTSSIRAGMMRIASESNAVVIMSVDQPVRYTLLNQLVDHLGTDEIRIPSRNMKRGHPPIFTKTFFSQLSNVCEEKQGLRDILENNQQSIHYIRSVDPYIFLNLNRIEDYKQAIGHNLD